MIAGRRTMRLLGGVPFARSWTVVRRRALQNPAATQATRLVCLFEWLKIDIHAS